MNNDNWWLALFLLSASNPDFFKNVEAQREQEKQELGGYAPFPVEQLAVRFGMMNLEEEKRLDDIQRNCSNVEWEQDMGAHIPFCKLTGDFCNMQCIRR